MTQNHSPKTIIWKRIILLKMLTQMIWLVISMPLTKKTGEQEEECSDKCVELNVKERENKTRKKELRWRSVKFSNRSSTLMFSKCHSSVWRKKLKLRLVMLRSARIAQVSSVNLVKSSLRLRIRSGIANIVTTEMM